jgi:hypothetical protein
MPEIGLLPFGRVAMDVATATLPTYRSRFSKHQFAQPQLLAIARRAATVERARLHHCVSFLAAAA